MRDETRSNADLAIDNASKTAIKDMSTNSEFLVEAVGRETAAELTSAQETIERCLGQLTDEQLWWRPAADMNSIANLILHLCGNVGQWICAGVGGADDARDRPQEFAERGPLPRADLLKRLSETVAAAHEVLDNVTGESLLAPLRIQGFETSGLGAVLHSVAHFRGHTQEIVHMTRHQLGENYVYSFVPQTPEQGAPAE